MPVASVNFNRMRALRWLTAVVVFLNVAFSYASERILPGDPTRTISERYETLFTPAPYTFSVWGLIYGSFIVYAIVQLLPSQRTTGFYDRMSLPLLTANVLSAVWLCVFRAELLGLSVVIILAMLGVAAWMFFEAHAAISTKEVGLWVTAPFSSFFAWITVASLADIGARSVYVGGPGSPAAHPGNAVVFIALALGACIFVATGVRDFVVPAVIGWAMIGIAVARMDEPVVSGAASLALVFCAVFAARNGYLRLREAASEGAIETTDLRTRLPSMLRPAAAEG